MAFLVPLAAAADARAFTARLRWLPGMGAPVSGWDLFVRPAGQPYGLLVSQ